MRRTARRSAGDLLFMTHPICRYEPLRARHAHRDPVGGSQIFVGSKREIPWRPQLNCGNVGNHVKPIERNPMEGPCGDRCPAEMSGHECCTKPWLQAGYDGSSATNEGRH